MRINQCTTEYGARGVVILSSDKPDWLVEFEVRYESERRKARRRLLWTLTAVLCSGVGLLFLVLLVFVPHPPSDELMISRFEESRAALVSLSGNEFVSKTARREWSKTLRIRGTRPVWYHLDFATQTSIQLYDVYSRQGMRFIYLKGYAYVPDGTRLPGPLVPELGARRIRNLMFRHIEDNWYLYSELSQ